MLFDAFSGRSLFGRCIERQNGNTNVVATSF